MPDDQGRSDTPDGAARTAQGRPRGRSACRRSALLALLVAAAAVGLAACGGPGSAGSPGVADVATTTTMATTSSSGGATTATTATTPAKDDAARSLVQWADCMHRHGDPDQPDPTIDAHGGINVFLPISAQSLSDAVHNGTAPCNAYLAAASAALRAGATDLNPPDQAALVRYAQCMRANGVPNYPDPGSGSTTNFNGTGIDPNSPFFMRANDVCGKKIGAPSWWISGAGPPGSISVQSGPSPANGSVPRRGAVVTGTSVPVIGG